MAREDLDRRIHELEKSVPLWDRLTEPDDANRGRLQRLAVRLWRAGLPHIMLGAALVLGAIGLLPMTGYTLVSAADAQLARVVRTHVRDTDRMIQDEVIANAAVGQKTLRFVAEVARSPIPDDTLSWLGRLSFNTPLLVRGDRLDALKDVVRLLGDLPVEERLQRLDWLVTLAAATADPRSGFAHGLEALSKLPLEIRQQLLTADAATLRSIIKSLQGHNAARLTITSLDQILGDEKDKLDQEIADRRRSIDAVKARFAAVSAIGAVCAAPWRRFEACTRQTLVPDGRIP
ncbi:MAG: hypothetical protein DI537_32045 [Stutzerimonas stutzeri]|nr:MAG: hypothetical protein DI537_32045 [Stutzerimonas stutzeri]